MNALVDALDRACPGCSSDETELNYMWMGDFVRHVADAHVAGRHAEVQAAFDVIERVLADKLSPDRNLAVAGFLEDMQNGNLHKSGSRPADFVGYLGPLSRVSWDGLNGFWQMVEHSKTGRKPD